MRTPKSIKENKATIQHLGSTLTDWRNELVSLGDNIAAHRRKLAAYEARAADLKAAIDGTERIIKRLKGEDK